MRSTAHYVLGVDVGSQGMKEAQRRGISPYELLNAEAEAARAAVSIAAYVEPRVQHQQAYADAYALYRDVYAALQEPFRKAAQ